MIFYDYYRSSAAYRCRIALNLKGMAPERRFVHLRRKDHRAADYLAVNPQGLVPALQLDDGTVLTQSLAIIEYLDTVQPAPPLLPADPVERARVRAIALAIACDIHPLQNLRVLNHLSDAFGIDEITRTQKWCCHWIEEGLRGVEGLLAGDRQTGRFCHGNQPTLADCCLVPQIFNARRFGCDLASYPEVTRIVEECMALPAFADTQPSRQPDAED